MSILGKPWGQVRLPRFKSQPETPGESEARGATSEVGLQCFPLPKMGKPHRARRRLAPFLLLLWEGHWMDPVVSITGST